MISVIILNHGKVDTSKCIKNIEDNSYNNISEIIIINPISCEEEYKSDKINIKTITLKEPNFSFSTLCNIGVKMSKESNDILIINDNCYFIDNSIENLQKALYSNDNIGIVTPITNIGPPHHHQSLDLPFDNIDIFKQYLGDKLKYNESLNEVRLRASFLAVLIKRDVFKDIGEFDDQFMNTDYASDDFCLRALNKGYKTVFCNHSFAYIDGQLYFNYPCFDQERFKTKWGFDPLYSLSIRNEAIERAVVKKDKEINILEVGCACGATLLKLKNIYKDANLYGVDINPESIEIAKHIDQTNIKCADIENDEISFEDGTFDLIIALDVLEHLRNPWEVLKKFKKLLKRDGQIIISIPNIMHISIINNLIQGRWDYQDSGILDITHLRFFTLKTIKESFASIGIDMIYYFSIVAPLSQEETNLTELFSSQYKSDKNQLMSYQYIITNKI